MVYNLYALTTLAARDVSAFVTFMTMTANADALHEKLTFELVRFAFFMRHAPLGRTPLGPPTGGAYTRVINSPLIKGHDDFYFLVYYMITVSFAE